MRSPDGMGTPIAPFRRVCGGICPLTTRSPVTRGRRMSAKSLLQRRLQQLTPESFNLRARARRRTRKRPALQRTTVSNGSAPVRDFRMQPFGRELVAVVGRHGRTTAIAYFDLLDGIGEGQVPRWTGHSPRKRPQAPLGRGRVKTPNEVCVAGLQRSACQRPFKSISTRVAALCPRRTVARAFVPRMGM